MRRRCWRFVRCVANRGSAPVRIAWPGSARPGFFFLSRIALRELRQASRLALCQASRLALPGREMSRLVVSISGLHFFSTYYYKYILTHFCGSLLLATGLLLLSSSSFPSVLLVSRWLWPLFYSPPRSGRALGSGAAKPAPCPFRAPPGAPPFAAAVSCRGECQPAVRPGGEAALGRACGLAWGLSSEVPLFWDFQSLILLRPSGRSVSGTDAGFRPLWRPSDGLWPSLLRWSGSGLIGL